MSELYRVYDDKWAQDRAMKEKESVVDKSEEFQAVTGILDEIHTLLDHLEITTGPAAEFLLQEMAKVVFGSNQHARAGLGLDETLKICMMIFDGEKDLEYSPRLVCMARDPFRRQC